MLVGDDYKYDADFKHCLCGKYRADPASGNFSLCGLRPLDLASAGVLRVFGTKVAELPLAVTYRGYRGKVRQACNSHSEILILFSDVVEGLRNTPLIFCYSLILPLRLGTWEAVYAVQ